MADDPNGGGPKPNDHNAAGRANSLPAVTFDPPIIPAVKDKATDGAIKQEVTVPNTLASDTDVKYQINVTDSDKRTADYNKDGAQKISLKIK